MLTNFKRVCGASVVTGAMVALASVACRVSPVQATGTSTSASGSSTNAAVLAEVQTSLAHGAAAWNRGDLKAFVSDYADGMGTTFIGRRGIVRGPAAIEQAYGPRFAPGGVRDSLYFRDVEVDVLAPDVINTIAWYVLQRGDSITATGPTSLVMRKVDGRWRIVHDHSS